MGIFGKIVKFIFGGKDKATGTRKPSSSEGASGKPKRKKDYKWQRTGDDKWRPRPSSKSSKRDQNQKNDFVKSGKGPRRNGGVPGANKENDKEIPLDSSMFGNAMANKKKLGDWQPPAPVPEEGEDKYFQNFDLRPEILRAVLEDLGFTKCTPIQGKALPHILKGCDMAGKAQTGTGKTAVFLMATLQAFLKSNEERGLNQPFALILAPTRELVIQIAKDANALSTYTPLRTVAVYGGMDYDRQRRLLQSGCDLIVATPGRLIDYFQKGVIDTSKLKIMVIDEADRMLDMGFIPDVRRIMYRLPKPEFRQTMLFSATLNHDIMQLSRQWMRHDPVVIEVEPENIVAEGINETVYACTSREKLPIMLWILSHEDCRRVIIFRNRRRDVEELHAKLQHFGISSAMLSGDVDQKKRVRILEDFRSGKIKIIVATDVAGRGIHVDDVTHVFNYDLPYEAEDYVHRVGRTARAGHQGRAISFAGEDCAFVIPEIESYIGRPLPITQPTDEMLVMPGRKQAGNKAQ